MSKKHAINLNLERQESSLAHDTRKLSERLADSLRSAELPLVLLLVLTGAAVIFTSFTEVLFVVAVCFALYVRSVQKKAGLALKMPKVAKELDPAELSPANNRPVNAEGIIYLGNDQDTGEEVWSTDTMARTHMLVMGTTGSGKTEQLVSLVFNALLHGSGLIYVDGKADSSLYGKVYSMARAMGREDDVLVINFQTGAKDIYGAQPNKLSNTLNPFANGSAGMLSELIKGLMQTGENSTWTQQAEQFVEALVKPLVFLRDHHGMYLDVDTMRQFFDLDRLEDLAWKDAAQYHGLEESGTLEGIRNYLLGKPGYKKENYHNQGETTHEQHGYIRMQLSRTFGSLADTYGYIMKTPLAEIDFNDVFLNRRILVVLLPALEKSPSELTNLGRIVVASLKATMAKGLGSSIEGEWAKVIDSKPTAAPSPFMCVLDEYGYYAVEGFAVVPAQARSLGFSAIFAGQDLPAFEKASKEEAASTLANTNTRLCGKLECTKTYDFFKDIAGQGLFSRISSYEYKSAAVGNDFRPDDRISLERVARVNFEALRDQSSGAWHLFFANKIVRLKSFYANPKPVKYLRVNHFVRVARPSPDEVKAFRSSSELFTRAIKVESGLASYVDRVTPPSDISDLLEGFEKFAGGPALVTAAKALAYCAQAEDRRAAQYAVIMAANAGSGAFGEFSNLGDETAEVGDQAEHDFARSIVGGEEAAPRAVGGGFDDSMPFVGLPAGAASASPPPQGEDDAAEQAAPSVDQMEALAHEMNPDAAWPQKNETVRADQRGAEPMTFAAPPASPPLSDEDRELLGGIPDDIVSTGDGESDFLVSDAEPSSAADRDFWPGDADVDAEVDSGIATRLSRGKLLPEAVSHPVASVFGSDEEPVPEHVAGDDDSLSHDASPLALTEPPLDEEEEFDRPVSSGGLLSREATVSGLAAIEQSMGTPSHEALMTANAVTEAVGVSTTYPMTPPSTPPTVEQFDHIARKVSAHLGMDVDDDE